MFVDVFDELIPPAVVPSATVEPNPLESLKREFDEAERDYQYGFASGNLVAQHDAYKRKQAAYKKIQAIKKAEINATVATQSKARQKRKEAEKANEALSSVSSPESAVKADQVDAKANRPVKPGSKAEQEINLLRKGCTKEEMMSALGWSRWHWKFSAALNHGYGICREADGRCYLVES